MENEFGKNLIVKDVISESLKLYKENFKLLFGINAIGVLVLFLTGNFSKIGSATNIVGLKIVIYFIGLMISLIGLYYSTRINVGFILAIKSRYNNERVGVKESFIIAKEFTWDYIGLVLLSGLIISIPMFALILGLYKVELLSTKVAIIIPAVILNVYLIVKYGFAAFTRVLRPEIYHCFDYSKKLVKDNFFKVLIVLCIVLFIQSPIYVLRAIIDGSKLGMIGRLIYNNFGILVNLFVGPFNYCLIILAYIMLDKD